MNGRELIHLNNALELTQRRKGAETQLNCAERLEGAELAPAFGRAPSALRLCFFASLRKQPFLN